MRAIATLIALGCGAWVTAESEPRPSLLGAHSLEESSAFALTLALASDEDVGTARVVELLATVEPASASARRVKIASSKMGTILLYCEGAPLTDLMIDLSANPLFSRNLIRAVRGLF